MIIQPETIASDIIDEIHVYGQSNEIPSTFTLAKLKREAGKLKSASPAKAAMILGMIACLERDTETCKKQHELSIRLSKDPDHYFNYFCSLWFLGLLHDAYNCILEGIKMFPGSAELIEKAIEVTMILGFYKEALDHYKDFKKLQPHEINPVVESMVKGITEALNINIPETTLNRLSYVVEDIRIKHAAKQLGIGLTHHEGVLFQWIETSADVDTTVDMNFELADALASETDIDLNNISVAFRAS